jgi:hypothetical protein
MITRKENGFVLVVVLWMLAILTVITTGFAYRSVLNYRAAAYGMDRDQALMEARGAVHRGLVALRNKQFYDALKLDEAGTTHLGQSWAKQTELFGKVYTDSPELALDTAGYIIEDSERYIDVNRAGEPLLKGVKALSQAARRKIIARRAKGVQDGEPPVSFHAVEELRYLREIKEDAWFGEKGDPGLRKLLTTYGDGLININTAPRAVLKCIPKFSDGAIDKIIAFRGDEEEEIEPEEEIDREDIARSAALKGFKNMQQAGRISGISAENLATYCKLSSQYFKIRGIATRRQGKLRAEIVATVLAAPGALDVQIVSWRESADGT